MNYLTLLEAGAAGGGSPYTMLIIWGVMIAFMWFVLIRPQRKKQKQLQLLQNSIDTGDTVLLNSGIYGKVVDKVNNILILELGTNKSVRVPVQKAFVAAKVDEDFLRKSDETDSKDSKKEDKKDAKEK